MESRYFIAIVPPDGICAEVKNIKEDFALRFNSKAALRSPAHITLHMPFLWKEEKEDFLIRTLGNFKFSAEPLQIQLNGFDHFDDRVIFVNVEENKKLNFFQKELVHFCKHYLLLFNQADDRRGFHPHVTVAFRDLRKRYFLESWIEYAEKPYSANFPLNSFSLMKHDGKRWNVYYTFLLNA